MATYHDPRSGELLRAARAGVGDELLRQRGLLEPAGLSSLLDEVDDLLHADPSTAEALAMLVDKAADHVALGSVRARARYQRAQLRAEQGELVAALELIDQARDLFELAGQPLAALRTGLGRMQVLDDLGRHAEATSLGESLIASLEVLGGPDPDPEARQIRAIATENLGVAYGLTGRHEQALDAYAEAEADFGVLGMQAASGRPMANRGVELLALGRPRDALREFGRAREIFAAAGDRLFEAQCLGDTAHAHRQLGEFASALALLEPARQALEELGAVTEAARLRLAAAETYLGLGLWSEALSSAEAASEATARAGLLHDSGVARFLAGLAAVMLGRPGDAGRGFEVAADVFTEVDDQQFLARVRLAQADLAAKEVLPEEADRLLSVAVDGLLAGGWSIPLTWAYLRRSEVTAREQRIDADLAAAGALVAELRLPELVFQYEVRAGRRDRQNHRWASAERHFRQAIDQLDRGSGALRDHALQTAFRAGRMGAHDALVELLVSRGAPGDLDEARAVSDLAKARTLVDLMSDSATAGPELAAGGRDLATVYADLNATYHALHETVLPDERRRLAVQAEGLERQVSLLRLQAVADQGAARPRRQATPDVDAFSSAGEAGRVLAFHVVDDDILALVQRGTDRAATRLPGALSSVRDLLDALRDQWDRFVLGLGLGLRQAPLLRSTNEILHRLYELLIEPFEDILEGGQGPLHIVPDGRMGAVPFQALYDGSAYLTARCALVMAPTHAAATRPQGPIVGADKPLVLAVADAYAPSVTGEGALVAGSLPGARLLSGHDATAEAFLRAAPGAGLIHVACHGVHAASNPLFSRLRLADRWITSTEIMRLRLEASLVTLSACESGVHGPAIEPVGLGWAFLAAGAAGVLVSQWIVHDEAAPTLMAALYAELAAGASVPEALRTAQLLTAESYPHPFSWASFSYVANPSVNLSTSKK